MMATELINSATSSKLTEVDWTKNIEICELVAHDQRQAKDVVKAVKKRLGSKNSNTQLYAVLLLETLMNNIGDDVYKQVIDVGILPILVKIVKKKTDWPVREKIFLLLDATQTSLGGAKGKFPQFYAAYYDLVSAGVQFPQRPPSTANRPASQPNINGTLIGELAAARQEDADVQAETRIVPDSSIIQKANNALEVLKEVLDAVDPQRPEGARDEFTLDLVEQCSFQKQRVMHLVLTSRDEAVVSQAIELNDLLQKVLTRHDELLSGKSTFSDRPRATVNHLNHEEAEEEQEEEPEQLYRRMRKGKACARPDDEEHLVERPPVGLLASSIPAERLNRPLIRPLRLEPSDEPNGYPPPPPVVIPPPPAKHVERERFFQESKADGTAVAGHMRGLSLHSRNASSSLSGSFDFSD
ncbi:TOM1-like protein 5 [Tripterygium wilfordii]|uniref:TOM1-like protein 5 n=1 Tax=Tripterygium wilfordii TaxID=458696 RepID=UPI0018F80E6F|nr:TOM1-like protein 5 [Tripterygium wilfordii]XP_038694087.1 TOM1-like protein 5 [Tripterygium wilfordii]